MNLPLSYSVTSLTPPEINESFLKLKHRFGLFYTQPITDPDHYILKNMAHVTLKRLFYLKEGIRDEEVARALSSIQFNPIPIHAANIELFRTQKHGNVLVVLVQKSPELQKLHGDLSDLIDTCASEQDMTFEKNTFNPHLSVLYNLPEEKIEEATAFSQQLLPLNYTLESFQFMRDVTGVKGEREMLKTYFAKSS